MIWWIALLFGLVVAAGIPIAFGLGIIAAFLFVVIGMANPEALPHTFFSSLDSFPLMAIPLFILAGEIMNAARLTERLVKLANALVGHFRGGLAQVNVVVNVLMAGLSGSAVADAAAIGSVLIPIMKTAGYDAGFSAALTAAGSVIGPIIPPSIAMILYGSALGVSIGALFAAGIVPGLLMGGFLMVASYILSRRRNYPRHETAFSLRRLRDAGLQAVLPLLLPALILVGIVGGIFTATEAAAVAVAYAAFLGLVVYRTLTLPALAQCLRRAGVTTGVVLMIVGFSGPFGWLLKVGRVPDTVGEGIRALTSSPAVALLVINLFLLFMGCIMDATANIIILAPILAPVAVSLGIDPLHFAMVMVLNLVIGVATPPVGVSLFVVAPLADVTLGLLARAIVPFIVAEIVVLALVTYVPDVALVVPRMLGFTW